MTSLIIIASTVFIYALFWVWYVGFGRKASPELIEQTLAAINNKDSVWSSDTHHKNIRQLLENDDGKEFFMVNLLTFKQPRRESVKLLFRYYEVFGKSLLKRAGHPVFTAAAAAGSPGRSSIPRPRSNVATPWDPRFASPR